MFLHLLYALRTVTVFIDFELFLFVFSFLTLTLPVEIRSALGSLELTAEPGGDGLRDLWVLSWSLTHTSDK